MKKILLLWILLFSFQTFAQQKAAAVKFDEFADYPAETVSPFYDRVKRFSKKMHSETPDKRALIIFYNPRKGSFPLSAGKDWAERASDVISDYSFEKQRIILIDGGYREYATLELWIVPKNAELPKPSPAFEKQDVVYCPEINIGGDGFRHAPNQPLNFSVVIKGAATEQNFPLEWSVSAGKIIKGQGTNEIKVDLSETDAENITAGLIVKNLPPECNAHAFLSTRIGNYPYKIDEFGTLYYSDVAARMDNFFIQLNNDPTANGYIIVYNGRGNNKKDSARIIKNINLSMKFRKYDTSRVEIVDGGYREQMDVEVYLIPAGTKLPKPTPTLNPEFAVKPAAVKKRRRISR